MTKQISESSSESQEQLSEHHGRRDEPKTTCRSEVERNVAAQIHGAVEMVDIIICLCLLESVTSLWHTRITMHICTCHGRISPCSVREEMPRGPRSHLIRHQVAFSAGHLLCGQRAPHQTDCPLLSSHGQCLVARQGFPD
jgi:hypothetical protein